MDNEQWYWGKDLGHFRFIEDDMPLGWRCPNCGKGITPHVGECSCVSKSLREKVDDVFATKFEMTY